MIESSNLEKQLAEEGFYISTTVGVSMRPMLRNRRDRVLIKPVGEGRLQKYDLPLYRLPDGKYVLHRVLEVRGNDYIIAGDNTGWKESVPKENVVGIATRFCRKGKWHDVNERGYGLYVRLWTDLYLLRSPIQRCRDKARIAGGKLKRRLTAKH